MAYEARRYTQIRLAVALGKDERSGQKLISGWVNGHALPDTQSVRDLVDVLGCDGHWLLTGEGQPFPKGIPEEDARRSAEAVRAARLAEQARTERKPRPKKKGRGGRKGRG